MTATHVITYNGYSLNHVDVQRYDSEPVYAEDGITLVSNKHVMAGTALISGSTDAAFKSDYDNANRKLIVPRANLLITIEEESGGSTQTLVSITGPDELGGPKGQFTITRLIGALSAVITFEIEWHQLEVTEGAVQDVLSHHWTTAFGFDESGYQTYTATGIIVFRNNATATTTGKISGSGGTTMVGANPDAYRLAVRPPLPDGFRRGPTDFLVDESASRLLYTSIAKEYHQDLPSPATVGSGTFTWDASIFGANLLGRKTLEIELTGLPGTKVADLLAAAVNVSKNRIRWSPSQSDGSGVDIIESIKIDEKDFFNKAKIGFRVTARSPRDAEALGIPNVTLLSDMLAGIDARYSDISPYGAAAIMATRRAFSFPTNTSIDKAQTESLTDASTTAITAGLSYQFPDREFTELASGLIDPGANANSIGAGQAEHLRRPYSRMIITERVEVVDSGMVAIGSRSITGGHIAFQTKYPVVLLISEQFIERVGDPPERSFLKRPDNTMLISDKSSTVRSRVDGNGNMLFSATFVRVVQLLNIRTTGPFSLDETNNIRFWPINNVLRLPFDPTIDSQVALQKTVFDDEVDRRIPVGTAKESYFA